MADTIALMKQRVLGMAIHGELVDQRSEDGTAEELVKSFLRTTNSNEETLDEPFRIPESWKWSMLSDIAEIIMGQSPPGKSVSTETEGIEFHQGKIYFGDMYLLESEQKTDEAKKIVDEDTLLLSVRAPVGNLNITKRKISIGRGLCGIKGKGDIDSKILFYFLSTMRKEMEEKSTGTTFKAIAGNVIKNLLVPLPPLAEQKRIVAKIEEIFTVIDQIGTKKEEALSIIKNMRQTALQEAIRGTLVEQDEDDEPADILYEKIQTEKEQLVKEKKIKKQNPLPEITADEVPFEIPGIWKWVRLGSLIGVSSGKNLTTKNMNPGHIPVYGGNGITGFHSEHNVSGTNILIGRVGAKCGNVNLVKGDIWVTDNAFITSFSEKHLHAEFLAKILEAIDLLKYSKSTAQPVISGQSIYPILVPLPPIAEQQRIVEKLDTIMAICDQMEAVFDGSSEASEPLKIAE